MILKLFNNKVILTFLSSVVEHFFELLSVCIHLTALNETIIKFYPKQKHEPTLIQTTKNSLLLILCKYFCAKRIKRSGIRVPQCYWGHRSLYKGFLDVNRIALWRTELNKKTGLNEKKNIYSAPFFSEPHYDTPCTCSVISTHVCPFAANSISCQRHAS